MLPLIKNHPGSDQLGMPHRFCIVVGSVVHQTGSTELPQDLAVWWDE